MHQTKKGNQWYFGMKAHIGWIPRGHRALGLLDGGFRFRCAHDARLVHGEEKKVWGDAGYQGQTEAIHEVAPERRI